MRVPGSGVDFLDRRWQRRQRLLPARGGVEAAGTPCKQLVAEVPEFLARGWIEPHVGNEVTPFARDTGRPHVIRLQHMRINIYDLYPFDDVGHHGPLALQPAVRWAAQKARQPGK